MKFEIGTTYVKAPAASKWIYMGVLLNREVHIFQAQNQGRNALLIEMDNEAELSQFKLEPRRRNVTYKMWFATFDAEPIPYVGQIGGVVRTFNCVVVDNEFLVAPEPELKIEEDPVADAFNKWLANEIAFKPEHRLNVRVPQIQEILDPEFDDEAIPAQPQVDNKAPF